MFHKILVAYDGSVGAERTLMAAIEQNRCAPAEVHVLTVEEHLPHTVATVDEFDEEKAHANAYFERMLERARRQAEEYGLKIQTELRAGDYDLIVMGHSGRSQVWTAFLGATPARVGPRDPGSAPSLVNR
jgi:nucleotide-binding universal stress UspA family protein